MKIVNMMMMMIMLLILVGSGEEGGKSERDAPVYGKQEGVHCQDQGQHQHDDDDDYVVDDDDDDRGHHDDDDDASSQDDSVETERANVTLEMMMTRMNNRVWNIISTQWINPLPSMFAFATLAH